MKNLTILIICTMFAMTNIFAQKTKADFDKSLKAGKSVYLVVTDKSSKGTDALVKFAETAQKTAKNTAVIKMDRDDKANTDLVTKYRLSGVELPIVMVIASNGVVSGIVTSADASAERLVSYVPTKTQAVVLLGFENGKAALIVCGKKSAKDKTALEEECKKAMGCLSNKALQVFVDVDNPEEKNFLDLIKPDKNKTTLLLFNGKGQYTGTLQATAKSSDIVSSLNKKIGGCCPGGSKSGCGK